VGLDMADLWAQLPRDLASLGYPAAAVATVDLQQRTFTPRGVVGLPGALVGHPQTLEGRLAEERRRADTARHLLTEAPEALLVADAQGTVREANRAAAQACGVHAEELIDEPLGRLLKAPYDPSSPLALAGLLDEPVAASGTVGPIDIVVRRSDGSTFPAEARLSAVQGPEGRLLAVTFVDVAARQAREAQLEERASTDELTGLANRRRLLAALRTALGDRASGPSALCFVDVDHFKYVNDSQGHQVGDDLLRQVAARLGQVVPQAVVARFGGDEFAVLAPGVEDAEGALTVARQLLASLERPLTLQGADLPVTASAGVVLVAPGDDPLDALRRADAAMYLAKRRGRAQAALFEDGLTVEATRRLAVAGGLQRALRHHELDLAYQPLVALRSRRVVAAEALVRWPTCRSTS
jgi:diguanylate cyclase (GGDEF)-like protein/PAS domain S-box-containing protein